jgi:hypothetical protein
VIGNHSHLHTRLPLLTDEGLRADLLQAHRAIPAGIDPPAVVPVPLGPRGSGPSGPARSGASGTSMSGGTCSPRTGRRPARGPRWPTTWSEVCWHSR